MEVYDIGDQPRITATFTNLSGVATDPSTVTCVVKSPSGASTTYTYGVDAALTRTSAGVFNLDLTLAEPGTYGWKFNGAGSLLASVQGLLMVRRSLA